MLLSRFWYVVLAAVAGVSLAAMIIVRSTYERDRGRDSETLLRGDQQQIDAVLRREARQRLNDLGPIASNTALATLMNTARNRTADMTAFQAIARQIRDRLRELNSGLGPEVQGQMLIAVDPRGYVVGRTGVNENNDPGEYIGGIPLVARAIDGYVRDDTWELQGAVYRMAARPVIFRGEYVGAIIHARAIDNQFVRGLSNVLGGVAMTFFASRGPYASADGESDHGRPAPSTAALGEHMRTLPQNAEWRRRGYTEVLQIQNGQSAVVYGRLAGMVGLNDGGFAVGRPRPVLPANYLLHAPSDQVRRVPWAALILSMLASAGLGLLFIYLERDRGEKQLRAMLADLAERKVERLDPLTLRGGARKLALAINEAFERAMREELSRAGAKPRRSVEDLDALLGPATPSSPGSGLHDIPPPPPLSGSIPLPPPPNGSNPMAFPPMGSPSGGGQLPFPPPPRPAGAAPPMPAPPMPAPPRSPPASPPAAPPPRPAVATTAPAVPRPAAPAATPAPAPATGAFSGEEDDDPTSVAKIPPGVLAELQAAQAAQLAAKAASSDSNFNEAAHWREVFDQFVATKRQCGEATETLVYEKFALTLTRHKEQLMQRTQCRGVRFQVYVKDNKATLKATPVK